MGSDCHRLTTEHKSSHREPMHASYHMVTRRGWILERCEEIATDWQPSTSQVTESQCMHLITWSHIADGFLVDGRRLRQIGSRAQVKPQRANACMCDCHGLPRIATDCCDCRRRFRSGGRGRVIRPAVFRVTHEAICRHTSIDVDKGSGENKEEQQSQCFI